MSDGLEQRGPAVWKRQIEQTLGQSAGQRRGNLGHGSLGSGFTGERPVALAFEWIGRQRNRAARSTTIAMMRNPVDGGPAKILAREAGGAWRRTCRVAQAGHAFGKRSGGDAGAVFEVSAPGVRR